MLERRPGGAPWLVAGRAAPSAAGCERGAAGARVGVAAVRVEAADVRHAVGGRLRRRRHAARRARLGPDEHAALGHDAARGGGGGRRALVRAAVERLDLPSVRSSRAPPGALAGPPRCGKSSGVRSVVRATPPGGARDAGRRAAGRGGRGGRAGRQPVVGGARADRGS